jgi:hypothetical protein
MFFRELLFVGRLYRHRRLTFVPNISVSGRSERITDIVDDKRGIDPVARSQTYSVRYRVPATTAARNVMLLKLENTVTDPNPTQIYVNSVESNPVNNKVLTGNRFGAKFVLWNSAGTFAPGQSTGSFSAVFKTLL